MLDKFITFDSPLPEPNSDIRRVIRDHKKYLIDHPETAVHTIDPSTSYPEQYNWYRYFLLNKVPMNLFYPIMVMNEITDMMSFDLNVRTLLIPDSSVVQSIISRIA